MGQQNSVRMGFSGRDSGMIKYIVTGLPRSGTAWAAAWLSTHETLCLHEPMRTTTLMDLHRSEMMVGISDTSLFTQHALVNRLNVPCIKLFRDLREIHISLRRIGIDDRREELITTNSAHDLCRIKGVSFRWDDLFTPEAAKRISEICGVPWSPERHAVFRELNIQNSAAIEQVREALKAIA